MLSGEGNAGERWKTTIGLISKKATLHVQHTFFVYFFAVVLHDYNVKLPKTFLCRKCRTCSRSHFFSLPLIFFLHWWPTALLILLPLLQIFMLFFQQKSSPLFFIPRSRSPSPFFSLSFAGLPLFLFFSVFLLVYIPNLWTWQLT